MNKGTVKTLSLFLMLSWTAGCSVTGAARDGAILSADAADAMIRVTVVEARPIDETLVASLD